ncbi:MAG TPA: trypsin-like peptidase domain-containing protein [Longimicrobium sp.]|jgi:endonuclease G|uniref:trypsin-like serine peptidase n=1 Tax=Longimicrobium sp. TaxID=2029185 RepID=UPI002ED93030
MKYPQQLDKEQRRMAESRQEQRRDAIRLILKGEVLKVERDRARLARVIADRVNVAPDVAAAIAEGAPLKTLRLTPTKEEAVRSIIEVDHSVPMTFADKAREISRAVGRLTTRNGRAMGSCFMISPRLLATAGHALPNRETVALRKVEFNFEQKSSSPNTRARFTLNPDTFFLSKDEMGLDCTIIALGEKIDAATFTPRYCPLSARDDKHALGFFGNLIHHPGAKAKQFVLRENRLIDRPDEPAPNGAGGVDRPELLAYRGQTDPGSSGAPVFNDVWNVVALHFWGGTLPPLHLGDGVTVQDTVGHGIRISAIVSRLQQLRPGLTPQRQGLLDEAVPLVTGAPGTD